jgi:hypothetical protein
VNLAYSCDFHGNCKDFFHAAKLRHGTDGFTSPQKEGALFLSVQNAVYFIMLPFFGSCTIRILYTGCAKIEMPNYSAKRLTPKVSHTRVGRNTISATT